MFPSEVVVAGNHELSLDPGTVEEAMDYMEQAGEEVVGVEEVRRLLTNCTYLEDSSVTLEGIRIHGSPWQPVFSNSAFNLPRGEELRQRWAWSPGTSRWAGVPEGTRLLVTHGPPLGVGDSCTYRGVPQGRAGGCRCSEQLPRVRGPAEEGGGGGEAGVPRVRARARGWVAWVVQGASGYGVATDGTTTFVNAATCSQGYQPTNPPVVLYCSV